MLYIISERYFLSDYILEALEKRPDVRLITCETRQPHGPARLPWLMMRYLRSQLFNRKGFYASGIFSHRFLDEIKRIKPGDKVLLFSFQNLKNLLVLDKELGSCDKSLFLWNPLQTINRSEKQEDSYAQAIHATDIHAYTFDSRDAGRYGFELVPQVYRRPDASLTAKMERMSSDGSFDNDFFFVGADKNRQEKLSAFMLRAKEEGLKGHVHLIHDRHSKAIPEELTPYYKSQNMPYSEYLDTLAASKAVLEILQPGQTGMTMRTLEALFLKRKLITDNADACNFPFYHPDNIYIIGRDSVRSIRDFLNSPLHPVSSETTVPYDIESWINRFL